MKHEQSKARSAQAVFDSHLALRLENDVEGDIEANYSHDVVLMTRTGAFHGLEGVRASARQLAKIFLKPSSRTYYAWSGETLLSWYGRRNRRAGWPSRCGLPCREGAAQISIRYRESSVDKPGVLCQQCRVRTSATLDPGLRATTRLPS